MNYKTPEIILWGGEPLSMGLPHPFPPRMIRFISQSVIQTMNFQTKQKAV